MKVYLFGPLRLEDNDGRPAPLPPTADGRTLLAFLLLYPDQSHGRSRLAALLKPDESEEKARRALTQALWQARRALPDEAIVASGDAITLRGAAVSRDISCFDDNLADALRRETINAAQAAEFAAALKLYKSDLLSDIYDDWIFLPREQRRERYLRGLELLIRWEKGNGRYAAALDHTLQLTQADPLRETAQREALRLYAALNRPQAAQRHYEQYRRYLQEELGVEPDAKTGQLAATIAAQANLAETAYLPLAAAPPAYALEKTAQMPLIGREMERGRLVEQLHLLHKGQGGLIFVSGASGVGKSRLLQEVARDAEWRGLAVAQSYGRELDAMPPYALFTDALDGLLTPLRWQQLHALVDAHWLETAREIVGGRQATEDMASGALRSPNYDPQMRQTQLLEAVSRLLLGLSQLRPLLLILDDAQWADPASLATLRYLSHRLAQQPILIIVAFRSEEAREDAAVWENLLALDAVGLRLRLRLDPLDVVAANELISRGLGLTHDAPLFAARLHAETAGSPLLLLESLRALHDEGLLYRDEDGRWHTPFDDETADYVEINVELGGAASRELIQRRLRHLPQAARETLQLAAVIGREIEFGWLTAASQRPLPELLTAVSLLTARQFLVETAVAYAFSHDKIRASVYEEIALEKRQSYHRQIAAVIAERQPTAYGRLAYHYREGEQWPEAVQFTLQAAEQARALSVIAAALDDYAAALEILERYHPLPPAQTDETRGRILIARQKLLRMSGRIEQQQKELAELRQLAGRLSSPLWQADALLREADFISEIKAEHDAAVALAEQALVIAQENQFPHREAEAWQTIGYCRYTQGRYQESVVALRRAVALWESLPDANAELMSAYLQLIYSERMSGRPQEGLALVHKLLALAENDGNLLGQGSAHSARGSFYDDQGDHLASIEAYAKARAIFQRIGARINEARALANIGYGYWCLHRYGEAIALTEESLAIFQETETQKSILLSYLNLSELYYDVGQLERGGGYTAAGVALARQLKLTNYELACLVGRAQALAQHGVLAAAESLLAEIKPLAEKEEEWNIRGAYARAQGSWLLAQDRLTEAGEAFQRAADCFAQEGNSDSVIAMHSFEAVALWRMGKRAEALALSGLAVTALEQTPGGEFIQEIYWHHSQILAGDDEGRETKDERRTTNDKPSSFVIGLSSEFIEKAYRVVVQQADSLPDEAWREQFWARPLHQKIRAAWEAICPPTVTVRLPRADAPTRGKVSDDQLIEIQWTPHHPADNQINDKKGRRQAQLARLLDEAAAQGARTAVADLAAALHTSLPTIKRDLAEMRS